jgi:hypothetical protein
MAVNAGKYSLSTPATVAIGAALLGLLLLSYYLSARSELVFQRNADRRNLADAHAMIQKEAELTRFLNGPGASMSVDASTVEQQVLHLFHDWEQQTGVAEPSFQRLAAADEHGFTRLTFQVSATGTIAAVSGLLYCAETATMPLRIDDAQVRPGTDNSDGVQIHLTVSTLCRGKGMPTAAPAADAEMAGDRL